jgi:glutaminyl-peptide cyclotransferase
VNACIGIGISIYFRIFRPGKAIFDMRYFFSMVLLATMATIPSGCGESSRRTDETPSDSTLLGYTVLSVLPHNPEAFTQGLVVYNNKVLESTGQNGTSWVGEVNPASGDHDKKIILDRQFFGEGITVLNNKLYYLTWKSGVGFIYDARTYKKIREFEYDPVIKQGWGLTHDNKHLIVSDGTDKIHFLDSATLKVQRTITVTDGNMKIKELNELEFVNGFIFANVWQTNWIVKIDPVTGKVVGKVDLSALGNEIQAIDPNADVLNGIAYDKNSRAFLITGKLWPKSYLVRFQKN